MTARLLNVTEEEYHADPCAGPSLSHSIAHTLVTESPRHAWLEHPKLGGVKRVATKAMDEGSILHRMLLGEGADFDLITADNFRTKVAQEQRDASVAAGRIPLLMKDFDKLSTACNRIRENAAGQGFPFGGLSEVSIEFTERADKGEILCRCRIDQVRTGHLLYDVKRVRSANPKDLSRLIVEFGYDIQWAAYTHGYEELNGDAVGRSDMVFLFCEVEPPYEVVPARLDGALREIGMRRWTKAVRLWEQLLNEGSWPWPGYTDGAVTLSAPPWVVSQELPEETW
jgi:hypothetical protein